ncbi:MAG: C-terminal target protein [Bacteroidetes bacterium]|nr:C-terminal target protein [Bacteroidota bacterium]
MSYIIFATLSKMVEPLQNIRIFLFRGSTVICFLLVFLCPQARSQPNWAWGRDAHTGAPELANDVAVDPVSGNVVMVGKYGSSLVSFYGSSFSGSTKGGFVAKYDPAGNVLWGFKIGTNDDNVCNGVAIDSSGNIYVTGTFENTADFRGLASTTTNLTATGNFDVFIAKYNSAGQLLWVKKGGGAAADAGLSVCLNSSAVFITGYYSNSGSFGTFNTVANNATQNVFVCAYSFSGSELWLADAGATQASFGRDIAADNSAVYLTGDFKGAALSIFNSSGIIAAAVTNTGPTKNDAYVLSYSTSGAFRWAGDIGSTEDEKGYSVSASGNMLYVTGTLRANTNFPGYSANPVAASGTHTDMYVAKLTKAAGTTQWVISEASSDDDGALCVANDEFGNVYVGGFYKNSISFAGGPTFTAGGGDGEQIFVVSYTPAGAYRWVRESGNNGRDEPYGIACSTLNEVYIAGEYKKDPVFGGSTLTDDGGPNIFIAKIACPAILNNTISSSQTVCTGTAPALLSGSLPSGGTPALTYAWEQSSDNITWVPATGINNTQNYSAPALTSVTYYRRRIFSAASCMNTVLSNVITISIDQRPDVSSAGLPQTLCAVPGTAVLNANTPVIGTGVWTLVSGGAAIGNPASATTGISGLSAGSNVFQWTISNGVCPSSSSTVTISVDAMPSVSYAGADQAICVTSGTSLNAAVPSVGSGAWNIVSGSGSITTPSSPSSAATFSQGINVLTWTVANGTCPSSIDTVRILVDSLPTPANAGADQTVCIASGATLAGNAPAVGNGLWTIISGSGSIASPASANSSLTSSSAGTVVLAWTISNGTCPSSVDSVSISIDALPDVSSAGADQEICASTPSTILNAMAPVTGSGLWTIVSGGGTVASPFSASTAVNSLTPGNNIFRWTVSNGVCPSSSDSLNVLVDLPPTLSVAGSDQAVCISAGAVPLNANFPLTGVGAWSLISGSGTFSDSASATASLGALSAGTSVLGWTISNGVCPPSRDTVMIRIDAMPDVANAGSDQTICVSNPVANLNALPPVTGTGTWSLVSGSASISTPFSAATLVSGLFPGATIFNWTVSNGVCPVSTDSVQVYADQLPTASIAGADQTICISAGSASLNANSPSVGTGSWSLITGSGSFSNTSSATSSLSGLSAGTTVMSWTISNGVCPSSSDTVSLMVDAMPSAANAGGDQHVCVSSSAATMNAVVPSVGTGVWAQLSGSGSIALASSPSTAVSGLAPGVNTFQWTVSNGVCPASVSTVNVIVDALPDSSFAGADLITCESSPLLSLSGNAPVSGTGQWSVQSGSGIFSDPASPVSTVNVSTPGTHTLAWTITNGVCPASVSTLNVRVDALPTAADAGNSRSVCISSPSVPLNGNVPAVGNPSWAMVSGGGSISSPSAPLASVSGLSPGANVFSYTISNGVCPSSVASVTITADELPDTAHAGADLTTDIPFVQLQGNSPSVGTGTWSQLSGTGTIASVTDPLTTVSGFAVGANIFRWEIRNGTCPASSDDVVITMNPLHIPNGFSPNGDGINDTYSIEALEYYPHVKFSVFNRWGNAVYDSDEYSNEWDGRNSDNQKLADDTYYFILEVMPGMQYSGFVIIKTK